MGKLDSAPHAFTFDDFMLVPVRSSIKSRKDPGINVDVEGFRYKIPVISSPMNTVTELDMLVTMCKLGGTGVLHRYMSIEDQARISKEVLMRLSDAGGGSSVAGCGTFGAGGAIGGVAAPLFYAAVGSNGDLEERTTALLEAGVTGLCVDVANGHNEHCLRAVETIKRLGGSGVSIMAGNVCSYDGARDLASVGASALRVGVGCGSMCTTRIVTGHGVPQLTALEECAQIRTEYPNVALVSDGGIRSSGDAIKALAIGADCVMIGSLLAGTVESPGEVISEDGRQFKYYHGMASSEGRSRWFDRAKSGFVSEGVSTRVPYVGRQAAQVVSELCESVKVGLSYAGANNIKELRENARWCRITTAGYAESTPHGKK
jgi:IMP dehydrogenase